MITVKFTNRYIADMKIIINAEGIMFLKKKINVFIKDNIAFFLSETIMLKYNIPIKLSIV